MDVINYFATTLNSALKYLQDNWLVLLVSVTVLWMVRGRIVHWMDNKNGVALGSPQGNSNDDRLNDMMRVRQKQQEEAEEKSKIAAQERKLKEGEEKERRNELSKQKKNDVAGKGNRLGGEKGGFNPLQPWSSGSGGGYKAQRRTVNRG